MTKASTKVSSSSNLLIRRSSSSLRSITANTNIYTSNSSRQNQINCVSIRWHGGPKVDASAPTVPITFINPHPAAARLKKAQGGADSGSGGSDEDTLTVDAKVGETLLQVAHRFDIDLEGACEGVCACSTCHLVFEDEDLFDSLDYPSEDEEDMLDMAFALTATSRLGCQVKVSEEMDGMVIRIPTATRNFYVDGHVPQPH